MSYWSDLFWRLGHRFVKWAMRAEGDVSPKSRRRAQKLLRMTARMRRAELLEAVLADSGNVVTAGPFQGMKVGGISSWGDGDILPKLLGTYESELFGVHESLRAVPLEYVINVGSAEGFYAVGAALTLDVQSVIAVDVDDNALRATSENASLNGVAHKVTVRPGLDAADLCGLIDPRIASFIVSDCEGFEVDLFTPEAVSSLRSSYCLIECHDFIGKGVTQILRDRFDATHQVEIITEGARNPNSHALLTKRDSFDRWLAVSEGRPETMRWLFAKPKASAAWEGDPRPESADTASG